MPNSSEQPRAARPNIVFIMSDDHAAHAMSCYGSQINSTPHMDRIAAEGMRLDSCLCTNSICAPSRAAILTGTHSHVNGVTTLVPTYDNRQVTFPAILREAGYQTAMIGKWHLGHGPENDPTGFDYWNVLPGQGDYHNPQFIENGTERTYPEYVTDIITDLSLDWLRRRDRSSLSCCAVTTRLHIGGGSPTPSIPSSTASWRFPSRPHSTMTTPIGPVPPARRGCGSSPTSTSAT